MKPFILLVAMAAALSQPAAKLMDQETLKSYLENGTPFDFILIDVRSSEEISAVIGNAACKPYNFAWPVQFQQECERIPKNRTVIVYCRSGGRSAMAAAYLTNNGFTDVHNAGGFITWKGPTIPTSEIKPASLIPEPSMRMKSGDLRWPMLFLSRGDPVVTFSLRSTPGM
jgi:rhodanese-related sulfurtransferase